MTYQELRLLSSGVDSLYFSIGGLVRADFLSFLEGVRHSVPDGDDAVGAFGSDRTRFLLKSHGLRGYPYWLKAPGYDLMVGRAEPAPPVKAELRSWFLHQHGPESAVEQLRARLELDVFHGSAELMPSRIDVYADIQGWIPRHVDFQRFVCRARYRALHQPDGELHGFGNQVSGFRFGRGAVVCRTYNKTLEQTVHKDTGASQLWRGFDPDVPVWRVEYQFRRQALTELGAASDAGVLTARQALWLYGIEWLSLRERSAHLKPSRWPEDPVWSWLRLVEVGLASSPLVRERMRKANLSRVISGLVGYLSSLGALTGTDDLVQVMDRGKVHALQYVAERGVPFSQMVHKKVARQAALWGSGPQ
jgi:hypothetical protein